VGEGFRTRDEGREKASGKGELSNGGKGGVRVYPGGRGNWKF